MWGHFHSFAAWVGSIPMAIMHLLAWLASWLISRYGLRNSTISAGVLLSGALFITSYAQNMNQIFLTFSIPFGLVGCVLLMSSFISVFTYFDKRLPLAMGKLMLFYKRSLPLLSLTTFISTFYLISKFDVIPRGHTFLDHVNNSADI